MSVSQSTEILFSSSTNNFSYGLKIFSEFLRDSTPVSGPGHIMQIDVLVVAKRPRFSNLAEIAWQGNTFRCLPCWNLLRIALYDVLKHCFLNIIYVRPICGAFCDAHHFKILVVFAIFTSSFKSLDIKYAYHAMGGCDFSSKPSLSVYFCQKPENIWLASQISGTTVPCTVVVYKMFWK